MKLNKQFVYSLAALIFISALYRILPDRPMGFAPQIAIALFAGSVIKDRKYSFALPILSMFISDGLYEVLYSFDISGIKGFYGGQWLNYLLFTGLTIVGFWVNKNKPVQIAAGTVAAPTLYFLFSNFFVWMGGGGYHHPKTFAGLMQTYADGIPFYTNSIVATVMFSVLFFGSYALFNQAKPQAVH